MYCGAEEALVVPYINTDRYHGQDGFNDVSFDETPDLQRVREERAWRVFSRVCQVRVGWWDVTVLRMSGSPWHCHPGGPRPPHQRGHRNVG